MKRIFIHIGTYLLLVLFFFLFCFKAYWNDLPRGVHQWAASDRYAITVRFLEDDRNILDPATLYMTLHDGDVGCELPLIQWTVAQIVKLGFPEEKMPFLNRFINFLILTAGLYLMLFYFLKKEWLSIRIILFIGILSSPILLFYGYNFLPDIVSLGLVLIALTLFEKNFEKHLYSILILLGLATVTKTLAGLYLLAFVGVLVFDKLKILNLKKVYGLCLFILIAIAIGLYDYYFMIKKNQDLWSVVFMSTAKPVASIGEFVQFIRESFRFKIDYFNVSQWIVIGITVLFSLLKWKLWPRKYKLLYAFLGVGIIGIFALFGVQFTHHDYYVLSCFMPVVLLLLAKGLQSILEYIPPKTTLVLATVFAVVSFTEGSNRNFMRFSENFHINGWVENYKFKWLIDIDEKIDAILEDDELIAVTYVNELNHSLLYLNRKGFTFNAEEMSRDKSPFIWWLNEFKVPYYICKKEDLVQFKKDQPEFFANSRIRKEFTEFYLFEVNGY